MPSTPLPRGATSRRDQRHLVSIAIAVTILGLLAGLSPTRAASGGYLLLSRAALQDLPTSGSAWDYLVKVAHADWPAPELDDQDSRVNVMALAAALVYARTGEPAMA
ncbi:MAG: hypothetical protein FIA92_00895, partial [Chloroflexi bacterium]|nr:hypothetical protein [Chloroflexota bacterium]